MDLPSQLCILLEAATANHHAFVQSMFTSLEVTDDKLSGFTPSKDLISNLALFQFAPPITSGLTKWHQGAGPMAFALHTIQDLEAQRDNWEI